MDEFSELLKKFDDGLSDQKPSIRRKVLIIDDNPNIRQGLKRTLTQRHYEVIVTATGQAGVESLSDDVCVVILDVKLPRMEGIEVYKLLKQKQPDIAIIFYSAYPGDESKVKKCLDLKPYAYIEKGVLEDIDRLYSLIEAASKSKEQK